MPYLIGTAEFIHDETIGLVEVQSEDEDEDVKVENEESDEEEEDDEEEETSVHKFDIFSRHFITRNSKYIFI